MGRGEETDSARSVFDPFIDRIVVCIDQRLLDQKTTHAMTEEYYWPGLLIISLDPDLLKQGSSFVDESCVITTEDCRRIVLVEEHPHRRVVNDMWKVVMQPQSAIISGRCSPSVPSMVAGFLASWVQTMNGNNASLVNKVKSSVMAGLTQFLQCQLYPWDRLDRVADHAVSLHPTQCEQN